MGWAFYLASIEARAAMMTRMAMELQERCWRAWWNELTPAERAFWRSTAHRPFLSHEQAHLLRAEGLPLVSIHSHDPAGEQVLFPLDLGELLEQESD